MVYTKQLSFLVDLKNASTLATDYYWEEDDLVWLRRYGGTIGIPKENVADISVSDMEIIEPAEVADKPSPIENAKAESSSAQSSENGIAEGAEKKSIDLSVYKSRRDEIFESYKVKRKEHQQAVKNRDRVAQRAISRELKAIESERLKVAVEIREKNNGVLPSWWHRDFAEADDTL